MRRGTPRSKNIIGQRFDRLTVISRAPQEGATAFARWLCRCDCGQEKIVRGQHLRTGNVRSCGCWQREVAQEQGRLLGGRITHGEGSYGKRTTEYSIWSSMLKRCRNQNSKAWPSYGGRGIKVCDRWIESYENFLSDMGRRPSKGHSLDRIDNDGNYEPENCRWATKLEQCYNQRRTTHFLYNGSMITLLDAAKLSGLKIGTIRRRISLGWSPSDVIEKPQRPRGTALHQ